MLDYDHYEHGMRIIDTDYKNFMLMYHCIEDYPEVTENETSTDVHSKLTHQQSISILLRDPNNYEKSKLDALIISLKEKVPGVDFDSTHSILDHSLEHCPAGDLFVTGGSLNTAELKEELTNIPDEEEKAKHEDL